MNKLLNFLHNIQSKVDCYLTSRNNSSAILMTTTILQKLNHNVSSNPAHVEVYSIHHYVIKFVSDLRQVGGFFRVPRFSIPIKLTATIVLKCCWKWR